MTLYDCNSYVTFRSFRKLDFPFYYSFTYSVNIPFLDKIQEDSDDEEWEYIEEEEEYEETSYSEVSNNISISELSREEV